MKSVCSAISLLFMSLLLLAADTKGQVQAGLYQRCGNSTADPSIQCAVPGSKCIMVNNFEPRMSCMCDVPEYVAVPNPNNGVVDQMYQDICAKVLPSGVPGNTNQCDDCNPKGSKCYGLPQGGGVFNDVKDGCKCDVSFSGATCHEIHVNVSCDFVNHKMEICYKPHSDVSPAANVYVSSFYNLPECRGTKVTETGKQCATGNYLLSITLPMDDKKQSVCNTLVSRLDQMQRFENTIEVDKDDTGAEKYAFTVYCEFASSMFQSAGFVVIRMPDNNRGESVLASLSMSILDYADKPMGENPHIYTKDKVKFLIELKVDDTYGALLPTYCIASPYGSRDSPKGININQQLLMDSCPVSDLPPNNQMKFKRKDNKPSVVVTDLMNFMKLKVGQVVYVHCKVKLCLIGDEDSCSMPACPSTRRKRDLQEERFDEEDTEVKLTLIDGRKSEGMSTITITTMGFAIIITLLVLLVVVIVVILVVLVLRLRARNSKVNDAAELTTKPQRFALPRINNHHLRI